MAEVATVKIEGKEYQLPIVQGSEEEKALDIRTLRGQSGYITLDNGFLNTGSCTSKITFLDGEKGIVRYRGYPIEQLAEKSNFIEVAWLLNFGQLPSQSTLKRFRQRIGDYSALPLGVSNIIESFPRDAHPMGVISAAVSSLCAFYPQYLETPLTEEQRESAIIQLMAQIKIIAAHFYCHSQGKKRQESDPSLGQAADLLNMMFQEKSYRDNPKVAKALDTLLILHADHEQNCSAATVRMIGSSQANIFATIAGGINALWGQLHGGANQQVVEMLEEIKASGGDYKAFIERAKDKNDSFRLMGLGHRVYKTFDPRAAIIKQACDSVLKILGVNDPLLDIALRLEEEARKDEYFIKRNLYPNVDFYSGIIYKALGIPTNMFTVMFVLGRLPGWLAQWKEMREDAQNKIARPRQIYTGEILRDYIPLGERS